MEVVPSLLLAATLNSTTMNKNGHIDSHTDMFKGSRKDEKLIDPLKGSPRTDATQNLSITTMPFQRVSQVSTIYTVNL